LQSITWFQVIIISRCNIIIYVVNVIVISRCFHDYTRCLIIYHVISCRRYGLVGKAKDNNRTDLLIDWLRSYLYTWLFVSLLVRWKWNTTSDVAAIISHINRHFWLTHFVFTLLSLNYSHTASNHCFNYSSKDPDWSAARWQSTN